MLSVSRRSMTFREHMDAALRLCEPQFGKLYPFLEFGLYSQQVRRYLDLFPRHRIGIYSP